MVVTCVAGVYGGQYCVDWTRGYDGRWCTYGCCGYLDSECCDAKYVCVAIWTVNVVMPSMCVCGYLDSECCDAKYVCVAVWTVNVVMPSMCVCGYLDSECCDAKYVCVWLFGQ